MIVIRTAEDMARALASALDPPLSIQLQAFQRIFGEYPDHAFEELGLFLIVEVGDRLCDLTSASNVELINSVGLWHRPETIERYGMWWQVTFVLSDEGYGIVLFVPDHPGVDSTILAACKAAHLDR